MADETAALGYCTCPCGCRKRGQRDDDGTPGWCDLCRMGITHADPAARITMADRRIIAQARAITVRRITGHEALSAAFGEAQQVLAELAAIIGRLSGEDDHG